MSKKLLIGRKALMEFGLAALRPTVMAEQELPPGINDMDIPQGMDPYGTKPPQRTSWEGSRQPTGEKLVGTGAYGPGGKQLTPQQLKYPNAARHKISGIPTPRFRDFIPFIKK